MKHDAYDSLAPRIAALAARHRTLEVRIGAETRRPLPDGLLIQELKRSKLAVKEELARLDRARAVQQGARPLSRPDQPSRHGLRAL